MALGQRLAGVEESHGEFSSAKTAKYTATAVNQSGPVGLVR